MSQLKALYGLPTDVQFCSRCVISNQRPSSTVEFKNQASDKKQVIHFDEEGVCSACRYQDVKAEHIDWPTREAKLVALCDRYRRQDGSYDVIVPGSGGKDSAFTAHVLKYKYGMNPLTVTWSPHLYTEIGWENFTSWMHEGGLDNILYTPNGKLHRLLTGLAFRNLLHPFQPFILGQRIIGPAMAARFGVELVMYGENQAEYGNSLGDNDIPTMNESFFSCPDVNQMMVGGVSVSHVMERYGYSLGDFAPYIPPPAAHLREKGVTVHYLGYYLKWDPQECYYYAAEHTGFQANPERTEGSYSKYSSIDDKTDPFHYYTTLIKFGLGRASYDAAQEVRNQKITREEAVHLVKRYDEEFPNRYFAEFLDYIDMSRDEFFSTLDQFRSPHLWERKEGVWQLRHQVTHVESAPPVRATG